MQSRARAQSGLYDAAMAADLLLVIDPQEVILGLANSF